MAFALNGPYAPKMTKSKYLIAYAFFFFSTSLFAQNNFREVGLSLSDNFNMGFTYKKQKAENRYISYDLLTANFGFISTSNNNPLTNISAGFAVTFEKRRDIANKVQFIHGWSPGLGISHTVLDSSSESSEITFSSPSLGYRLGFLYQFSENFYASLQGQIIARANLQFRSDNEDTLNTFGVGFSQQDVSLNLVYRFKKKE